MEAKTKQQGVALVIVLLVAMVFMGTMLTITSSLIVTGKKMSVDQTYTLRAQYAADSGLAFARMRLIETQKLLATMDLPASTLVSDMQNIARSYCGVGGLNFLKPQQQWSDQERLEGFILCEVSDLPNVNSIFEKVIRSQKYQDLQITENPSDYWEQIFATNKTPFTNTLTNSNGVESGYNVLFGYIPREVRLTLNQQYRFVFEQVPTVATGYIENSSKRLSERTINLNPPRQEFYMQFGRPSFAQYGYFVNENTDPTGSLRFVFSDTTKMFGRVHINSDEYYGKAWFWSYQPDSNDCGPRFHGFFSMVSSQMNWKGGAGCENTVGADGIFRGGYEFGAEKIALPANSNNQLNAVLGKDPSINTSTSEEEINTHFGLNNNIIEDGVYFSAANNNGMANQDNKWLEGSYGNGGIYVKGDVFGLGLTTENSKQVITIRQGTNGELVTTFLQQADGTWQVTHPNEQVTTLNDGFNGLIYVDGNIGSTSLQRGGFNGLYGDSTNKADIAANSQITVSATGHINVKQSITYTDDPRNNSAAKNVLGLHSSQGSIRLDGPDYQDISLHATMMAAGEQQGYGVIEARTAYRGYKTINLLGGIIQNRYHGVGKTTGEGYTRNYEWDNRFEAGFAPPFFPTQTNWEESLSRGLRDQSLWQLEGH